MSIQEAYKKLLIQLYEVYDNREADNIANMVIEHITGQKKIDRILNKTIPLSNNQLTQLADFTFQLLQHKPVQYILNEAWFAGSKYYVDEHVLIPRPETEELVSWIIDDINRHKRSNSVLTKPAVLAILNLLDIGTGSGCIPITLQKRIKDVTITSIDVSNKAIEVAKRNAGDDTTIDFLLIDFLNESQWKTLPEFDIIVSNPPYIKLSESENMNKNVIDFEPHLALFVPDNDALLFYRKIALFGKLHLKRSGEIYVEINEALGEAVSLLFLNENYTVELKKDLQGKDRMLKAILH